ncbi:cellulase family glycosylhydrolase [Telmatospirillum sp.]|uniref:glycoside hydrolase family 5 protein n=1 Tax=Telmatospirillum sp. TaxID=2079197 RepID=UPI00283D4E54|nr:cellulase family glycosylhydrolase [Telmatospirillum sp.]MDR3436087.1 cellulase family glycosylhydrolase [Telmatospirillum sp.]
MIVNCRYVSLARACAAFAATVMVAGAAWASGGSPGVNLSLFPSGLNRHDTADAASEINRQRVAQAKAAGFKFIRLGIPFDAWTSKADPAEQARVLTVAVATVGEILAAGMTLDIGPQTRASDVVCRQIGWDIYVEGLSALLDRLPDSKAVAIEAMSEPPSCPGDNGPKSVWAGTQQTLYQLIRRKLPHATFVVTGTAWGQVDGLIKFDPSPYLGDPNTLFTFHDYEPFLFTHQATTWLRKDHANQYVHDLDWPVTEENRRSVETQALAALAADPNGDQSVRKTLQDLFSAYQTEGTPSFLAQRFESVANWARTYNIPANQILLGEYGVRRVHLEGSKPGTPWRTAPTWLASVRDQAERAGFVWAVWDLDSGFGLICGDQLGHGDLCSEYRSVYPRL